MGKPIAVITVFFDSCLHTIGQFEAEIVPDCLLRTLYDPSEYVGSGILLEIPRVVLDVAFPGNGSIEGNHNQTPPDARIHRADTRQMVRIKHQRVARREIEWRLVLLFPLDLVRGTQLLDRRCREPHPFLKLGSNQEPLAFDFGDFRLHVSPTAHGQRVR